MTLLINADHAGEKPRVGERGRDEDFREEGCDTGARKNFTKYISLLRKKIQIYRLFNSISKIFKPCLLSALSSQQFNSYA